MAKELDREKALNGSYARTMSALGRLFGADSRYVQLLQKNATVHEARAAGVRKALGGSESTARTREEELKLIYTRIEEINAAISTLDSEKRHKQYLIRDKKENPAKYRQHLDFLDGLAAELSSLFLMISTFGLSEVARDAAFDAHEYCVGLAYDRKLGRQSKANIKIAKNYLLRSEDLKALKNKINVIQEELIKTNEGVHMANNHFNVAEECDKVARRNGVTLEAVAKVSPEMASLLQGSYTLKDLDSLMAWNSQSANGAPLKSNTARAIKEMASNIIIPHIDYFVLHGARNHGSVAIEPDNYPHLTAVARLAYNPAQLTTNIAELAKREQEAHQDLDFADLMDPAKGDHFSRLKFALQRADASISDHEELFVRIEQTIAKAAVKIEQSRLALLDSDDAIKKADRRNAKIREEQEDRLHKAENRLRIASERSNVRGTATFFQSLAYGMAKVSKGIPVFEGLTETVSDFMGHPNLATSKAVRQGHLIAAEVEAEEARIVCERLGASVVDVNELRREKAIIASTMKELKANAEFQEFEKDRTKQEAIAKAFVNKMMLSFGLQMSTYLQAICEEHGVAKVDDFFQSLGDNSRYQEAFTHLCFGFADSNDLSVLLAEAASEQGPTKTARIATEFVEKILKPNIAALYTHAAKVDVIYQANLTSLGSKLHAPRAMLRDDQDKHMTALFSDAFGVDSSMGELTVIGALDVKNLFDYYLHRHGADVISDAKLRDGKFTGKLVPKRVSALSDSAINEHKTAAKMARGFRQEGPEIDDVFIRTCAYEYFYPQAMNAAVSSNIMRSPEAPAAHVMVNTVVHGFIKKMYMAGLDDFRAQVGDKLDAVIAQTFMDYFKELGQVHASDPKIGLAKADVKAAAKDGNAYGFAFDHYERQIANDGLGRFDLFMQIYAANLQQTMVGMGKDNCTLLEGQLVKAARISNGLLNPGVTKSGSEHDRYKARYDNHTLENTTWRRG